VVLDLKWEEVIHPLEDEQSLKERHSEGARVEGRPIDEIENCRHPAVMFAEVGFVGW
jgi:hypothetical protein